MEDLNSCQERAFAALSGIDNVFLTGAAGSGKSYLIRRYLEKKVASMNFAVLASTGAAAVLVGGRTFHSFFGLGIMQGGLQATVDRALANSRLVRRLKKADGVIIDEVSMLSGLTLRAAETIARLARQKSRPWGGLRVIAVGDFAQLPPVSPQAASEREWAFLDPAWEMSAFSPAWLQTIVRTKNIAFLEILNLVREGMVDGRVREFLESRRRAAPLDLLRDFEGTRLFSRRDVTERYNLERLEKVPGSARRFETVYFGAEKAVTDLKRFAPVPDVITLKEGALVMLRQNDVQGRWVNGSLGQVTGIQDELLKIRLQSGNEVGIEPASFTLLDAEGKEVASARNFPVNLAYATTIHKAQGMTLDKVMVDLRNLWEPGQAYVALSRVTDPEGLFVTDWNPASIKTDPAVRAFYRQITGAGNA